MSAKKEKNEVSEKIKDYISRAHSFQEVGTEQLPDKDYDVLHFPHIIFASGVIMSMYGYFIIYISTAQGVSVDGLAALIVGNIIATVGIIRLLKKYWSELLILMFIGLGIIFVMMIFWDFLIYPLAGSVGLLSKDLISEGDFFTRVALVILTTLTFSYTACFVWFILARYTSTFYFRILSRGKESKVRVFLVDPFRKTLTSKYELVTAILYRIIYPFLFILSLILYMSEEGEFYYMNISWNSYFEAVLLLYLLLCAMAVLFPAFWLLDYVRYFDDERLEVTSMGETVLILVYGYAGIGTLLWFIQRSQGGILVALMELYMVTLYIVPALIILIGGYVLLTERDVYYIADQIVHGDKVIVDYKLIDSDGNELKWWISSAGEKKGGESGNE